MFEPISKNMCNICLYSQAIKNGMALQSDALVIAGAKLVADLHSDNMDKIEIAYGSKETVKGLVAAVVSRKGAYPALELPSNLLVDLCGDMSAKRRRTGAIAEQSQCVFLLHVLWNQLTPRKRILGQSHF